jgi:hypothetical protein
VLTPTHCALSCAPQHAYRLTRCARASASSRTDACESSEPKRTSKLATVQGESEFESDLHPSAVHMLGIVHLPFHPHMPMLPTYSDADSHSHTRALDRVNTLADTRCSCALPVRLWMSLRFCVSGSTLKPRSRQRQAKFTTAKCQERCVVCP